VQPPAESSAAALLSCETGTAAGERYKRDSGQANTGHGCKTEAGSAHSLSTGLYEKSCCGEY